MGTFNQNVLPSTTGLALGSQVQQWNAFLSALTANTIAAANISLVRDASQFVGADIGAQVNAAIADIVASGLVGGVVYIPAGNYTFSTPIVIGTNIILCGAGAGAGANWGTRLAYSGSGTAVTISGTSIQAQVRDIFFDATTSNVATCILIDNFVNHCFIEHCSIFSNFGSFLYGIVLGKVNNVVDVTLRDLYLRNNAVHIKAYSVEAHLVLDHVRCIQGSIDQPETIFGDTATGLTVDSLHCTNCTFETNPASTHSAVQIQRVLQGAFDNCFFEADATAYCLDIPSTAALAATITVSNSFLSCPGTSPYAIRINVAFGTLNLIGNYSTMSAASPTVVQNSSSAMVYIIGCGHNGSGSPAFASGFTNVTMWGNTINNARQTDVIAGTTVMSGGIFQIENNGKLWAGRVSANQGTAYSAADSAIALSPNGSSTGWGGGVVSAARGYDQALTFTVTAAGTPGADPTVVITFKDGTWTNAPIASCQLIDGTGTLTTKLTWVATATTLTITYNGTPGAGSTYVFSVIMIGT